MEEQLSEHYNSKWSQKCWKTKWNALDIKILIALSELQVVLKLHQNFNTKPISGTKFAGIFFFLIDKKKCIQQKEEAPKNSALIVYR